MGILHRATSNGDTMMMRRRGIILVIAMLHILQRSIPVVHHYFTRVYKIPCYISEYTGRRWVHDILNNDGEVRSINAFRMEKRVFLKLCGVLEHKYGLRGSSQISVMEKVAIFVNTMAWGQSQRNACERFQRSTYTISEAIRDVCDAIYGGPANGFNGLARELIKPRDPEFRRVPEQIVNDNRYWPYFKVTI